MATIKRHVFLQMANMSMTSLNYVFLLSESYLCFQNRKFFQVTLTLFPVEKVRLVPMQSQYKK